MEQDVHEEPDRLDPVHHERGQKSGLSIWLCAALFMIVVALIFYAIAGA
jgi:hypothetical protein